MTNINEVTPADAGLEYAERETMKKNPSEMTSFEIAKELENFEWEYIVLADKAQTDEYYNTHVVELDARKQALTEELYRRTQ